MNILVLGGTGYLGSKLLERLLNEEHFICAVKRNTSDMSRVNQIKDRVKWVLPDEEAVNDIFDAYKFDLVINTACNYGRGSASSIDVINSNVNFPLRFLDIASKHGVDSFFSMATGLPDSFNVYSFSKKIFSDFGHFYEEKYGITFVNFRLEMFYGADEPADRFIPYLVHKLQAGENVKTTLGTQRRDIISAIDVVEAIVLVMSANLKGYYNIPVGTGVSPYISEVVDFIWEETGRKGIVSKGAVPMRPDEPDCTADISFLKSLGEWNPLDWKTGIRRMISEVKRKDEK